MNAQRARSADRALRGWVGSWRNANPQVNGPVSEPLRPGCTRTAPGLHTPPQPQLPGPAVTPAAARGVARWRDWLPGLGHVDDGGRRHLQLLDPELTMRCQDGRLFEHAPV